MLIVYLILFEHTSVQEWEIMRESNVCDILQVINDFFENPKHCARGHIKEQPSVQTI